MKIYGVIGAGGFGQNVMPLVQKQIKNNKFEQQCFFVVEDNFEIKNKKINGVPVLKLSEFLNFKCSERYFNIAIGNSLARERIEKNICRDIAKPFSIHANEHINLVNNNVEEGAIFCPYTLIAANVKIGKFFHGNMYSYVSHDCIIGDYVTFGPGVKCNGHVIIEDHAYIGSGAVIKDGTHTPIKIGKGAIVGMGAVVIKSVPSGETVVGNPARIIGK